MDAYGYLNTRLGGHQAYASKVIEILEEEYVICRKQDLKSLLKAAAEFLSSYQDDGPAGEGWKSDELKKLISDIETLTA